VYAGEERHWFPLRFDAFGWANHLGLVGGLLLIFLLVLSNDWSLTRLGARRWKGLQRWNYLVFGLVVVHGLLYQVLEKRIAGWVVAFAILNVLVVLMQVAGFQRRQKQKQLSTTR